MPTKCTWCGIIYTNSEHIFWGCSKVKEFWLEYGCKPGKWFICFIPSFVHDLLNPQNLDLCSRENNQSCSTKKHKLHVLNITKEYLLICQKVGVLPSTQEIDCQFKAMRYSKDDFNLGRYWHKCPLPPPRGKYLWYQIYLSLHKKALFIHFKIAGHVAPNQVHQRSFLGFCSNADCEIHQGCVPVFFSNAEWKNSNLNVLLFFKTFRNGMKR